MIEQDESLILLPHENDVFLLEADTKINLRGKEVLDWFVNEEFLGQSVSQIFIPKSSGSYQIKATSESGRIQELTIFVRDN